MENSRGAGRPRRRTGRIVLLLVLLGLMGAVAEARPGLSDDGAGTPPRQHETVDGEGIAYVTSQACRSCHEAQYDAWQASQHSHAMAHADAQNVRGDFEGAELVLGEETVVFAREGERYLVHRTVQGITRTLEVSYTFGWEPLQQYLVAAPGGRLQALDLAWDVEGGAWIALFPEVLSPADPLHWSGLQQNWNFMCADCHTTGLRRNYDAAANAFATTWSEVTIGCEACHGAGGDHVARAQRGEGEQVDGEQGDGLGVIFPKPEGGWTLDPGAAIAHWQGEARGATELEVCGPCHARRRLLAEPLSPGGPLLDMTMPALLDEGLYRPDGRQQDEVFVLGSFLQSAMAQAGVTCSDCHEPHGGGLRAQGNALCAQCHEPGVFDVVEHHHHEAASPAAQCVSCHMPADLYMAVDWRRDHGFRVPDAAVAAVPGVVDACADCHDSSQAWAEASAAGWWAGGEGAADYAAAIAAGRVAGEGAGPALAALAADSALPPIQRATALSLLGGNLRLSLLGSFLQGLHDDDPLVRLGAVRGLFALPVEDRYAVLAPLVEDPSRAVRMEVAVALSGVVPAGLPAGEAAALEALFAEMEAVENLHLDRPESHANIAGHLAEQGRLEEAEQAYRAALVRDPAYIPAWLGLSELARVTAAGDSGAISILRQGLEAAPEAPDLLYALGLASYRQGDLQATREALGSAWRLAGSGADYAYAYALTLDGAGDRAGAIAVLRAGIDQAPNDRDLLYSLVALLAGAGDLVEARAYARRLVALEPEDPAIGDLLRQLGG